MPGKVVNSRRLHLLNTLDTFCHYAEAPLGASAFCVCADPDGVCLFGKSEFEILLRNDKHGKRELGRGDAKLEFAGHGGARFAVKE